MESGSFYQPKTFSINYRFDYIQNDGNPTEKAIPVYCHEYLHYVQDVSSVYGVKCFLDFFDAISEIALYMKRANPFIPYKKYYEYSKSYLCFATNMNEYIKSEIVWDDSKLWTFENFRNVQYKDLFYKESLFKIPRVEADFIDNVSGETLIHAIGTSEIKEAFSMAIEYHCLGEKDDIVSDVQNKYCVIERILSKVFNSPSNKLIAVVCFWSLQSIHPAIEFKNIYNFILDKNDLDEKEINDLLRERFWENNEKDFGQLKCSINDLLEDYEDSEVLSQLLRWYDREVLSKLEKTINGDFLLKLFDFKVEKEGAEKEIVNYLKNNIPIFLFNRGDDFAWTMSEKDDGPQNAFLSKALNDLIYHIHNPKEYDYEWKCPFIEMCGQKKNSSCEKKPWKYEKNCPYVAAARLLNIGKDKEFKVLKG